MNSNGKQAHLPNFKHIEIDMGEGHPIIIETGKLAKQADGSVVVKCGETMLLATVVSSPEPREGADFFPLSVDYQEKYASAGKIPGSFFKREGRLTDYEVLICRLVDRILRPLFPDNYYHDTQVMISLVSADKEVMPDALAALAASAALTISDIPFMGPISEVRVARIDGKLTINPTRTAMENADLDLIVGASEDNVAMVEGEMKEVSEADMIEAIKFAHEAIKKQCKAQTELAEMLGNVVKREVVEPEENEDIKKKVEDFCKDRLFEIVRQGNDDKADRKQQFKSLFEELIETFGEEPDPTDLEFATKYFKSLNKYAIREVVLSDNVRIDGRKLDEIRPIWMEIDLLPATHGSALFTRGETQSLTTVTLGTKLDEQLLDNATFKEYSKFILHYNFPGFSTGEVRPNRGPGRREVGHGNLAMRSLKQVLPDGEDNPYTIRVVSDILESNGSSSMATVCAGSLGLMDCGVQISNHVAGIAMGLISDDQGRYAVLSDILGDEDHIGDMDFKVTGTVNGICGCQMDIKIEGLSYEVLAKALDQARQGRMHILELMSNTINTPRSEYKPHVPRMEKLFIAKEFIGAVIGPGGKVIQELQAMTNTVIIIEEVGNQGEIVISGENKESIDQAVDKIKAITAVPQTGEVYEAKVKSIMPYGAFVEFLPGKEGLLHISEISWKRIETMDGVMQVGDMVKVKLLDIDKRSGKFKLSRKALLERPQFKQSDKEE